MGYEILFYKGLILNIILFFEFYFLFLVVNI